MALLPNADKAVIPIEKFLDYALNEEREPNKAKAFKEALGYDSATAYALIENIRENITHFSARKKSDNGYGTRYEVNMKLIGINGKAANVTTAWIVDRGRDNTRLTSAYVTRRRSSKED